MLTWLKNRLIASPRERPSLRRTPSASLFLFAFTRVRRIADFIWHKNATIVPEEQAGKDAEKEKTDAPGGGLGGEGGALCKRPVKRSAVEKRRSLGLQAEKEAHRYLLAAHTVAFRAGTFSVPPNVLQQDRPRASPGEKA
jgi:hypothetical protein